MNGALVPSMFLKPEQHVYLRLKILACGLWDGANKNESASKRLKKKKKNSGCNTYMGRISIIQIILFRVMSQFQDWFVL